ncbi:DUF4180 domain-containing protein, partial [Chitinophaga sp.]|uniref:DUF4180 domain-containing protein n=1 Tax=Chitinophaga sp. TaxID=1869181 RepID=UPI002F949251
KIISDTIAISNIEDALDILGNCSYQGADNIILHEQNITPDFFDLKTKIAGEILQKFSTYNVRLAIVGDFTKYTSQSLKDFIYESNKGGRINFVNTVAEATEKLAK